LIDVKNVTREEIEKVFGMFTIHKFKKNQNTFIEFLYQRMQQVEKGKINKYRIIIVLFNY
jgi:hypothetical protein